MYVRGLNLIYLADYHPRNMIVVLDRTYTRGDHYEILLAPTIVINAVHPVHVSSLLASASKVRPPPHPYSPMCLSFSILSVPGSGSGAPKSDSSCPSLRQKVASARGGGMGHLATLKLSGGSCSFHVTEGSRPIGSVESSLGCCCRYLTLSAFTRHRLGSRNAVGNAVLTLACR